MNVRRVSALSWVLSAILAVPSLVFLVLGPGRPAPNDLFGGVAGLSFVIVSLAFATVGAIVASRLPANPIGWIFCVTGVATAVGQVSYQYANLGLHAPSEPLAGSAAAAWLSGVTTPIVSAMFVLSVLFFPDGRLPSRRSRLVVATTSIGIASIVLASALAPGPLYGRFAEVSNPFGVAGAGSLTEAMDAVGWLLVWGGLVLATVAASLRLRRSHGVERQQLKWVLTVGAVVATTTIAVMGSWFVWPEGSLQLRMAVIGVSFSLFPAGVGIAILRYRLYDIDVVINRALVYGGLTATLAAMYLASVLLLQLALSPVTADNGLAIAASTLAVAALFRPARRRIQLAVDRRFYRQKYDAARTLEQFGVYLRDEVDLEALATALRRVVGETMRPQHVSLWLRER